MRIECWESMLLLLNQGLTHLSMIDLCSLHFCDVISPDKDVVLN